MSIITKSKPRLLENTIRKIPSFSPSFSAQVLYFYRPKNPKLYSKERPRYIKITPSYFQRETPRYLEFYFPYINERDPSSFKISDPGIWENTWCISTRAPTVNSLVCNSLAYDSVYAMRAKNINGV